MDSENATSDVKARMAEMEAIRAERRFKAVVVPEWWVMFLLQLGVGMPTGEEKGSEIMVPAARPMPADAFIIGLRFVFEAQCLMMIVGSREFEPVPDGEAAPLLRDVMWHKRLVVNLEEVGE